MPEQTIPAGALLAITSGEYSDYNLEVFVRALRKFDPQEVLAAYLQTHPDQARTYKFNRAEFLYTLMGGLRKSTTSSSIQTTMGQ